MSPYLTFPLLLLAGFLAGVANVVAGGGSMLTLPVLVAVGLPAHVANGTNRIGIALQSVIATVALAREGQFELRLYLRLLPSLLVGAVLGALLATRLSPERLHVTFGVLFLLLSIALGYQEFAEEEQRAGSKARFASIGKSRLAQECALLLVGSYAGFIQIGAAILIVLIATRMLGADPLAATGVKLPLVLTFTLPVTLVFLDAGHIAWLEGATLAVGAALGSMLGVKLTLAGGARFVQRTVIVFLGLSGLAMLALR